MVPVIYEDEWLVIVDKPSGLLVIPTPKNERHTLTNMLNEQLQKDGVTYRLHPCHRLDRDTSGLVIYAKGKAMQQKMMEEFKEHRIYKQYLAIVQGRVARPKGQISLPIDGRESQTKYQVLEQKREYAVVEVLPVTGRKNQIRLHFAHIGNPILGDTRFVFRRNFTVKSKRLCLHAQSLQFLHPMTQRQVSVESRVPDRMQEFMD
ncbi:MAG: RNA pseudouridine synthase [Candidatus Omnitrophota bacterium]